MIVLGLDLSLTSTGICRIEDGEAFTRTVKSKGKKGASVADTALRINNLCASILWDSEPFDNLDFNKPSLAVIEAPSYGSHTGSQHERGGLWWAVAISLEAYGIPIATVSPQGRAKYATGKGNAGKDEVLAAVVKRYADVDVSGNDVADAVVLAAMGSRRIGRPIDDPMPQVNLAAMDGARWPN